MSQSLVQVYLHVVFSTKNRVPHLKEERIREKVHAYLAGACKNLDCSSLLLGGTEDHVHILCCLSKNLAIKELIRELKRESSKWVKEGRPELRRFAWQAGYGAFSISPAHVEPVRRYIAGQMRHHHREAFQDEFRRLLKKYNVRYDERYVWD